MHDGPSIEVNLSAQTSVELGGQQGLHSRPLATVAPRFKPFFVCSIDPLGAAHDYEGLVLLDNFGVYLDSSAPTLHSLENCVHMAACQEAMMTAAVWSWACTHVDMDQNHPS